jgi:hypothetical protein
MRAITIGRGGPPAGLPKGEVFVNALRSRREFAVALALLALAGIVTVELMLPARVWAVADVTSSNVFTLPVPASGKAYASSSGDLVVWQQSDGIWGYDRSEARLFQVPTLAASNPIRPKTNGRWVVFQEHAPGQPWDDSHLIAYDLSTDTTLAIEPGGDTQSGAAISGDTVVWESPDQSDAPDIFGANLTTGATFTVTAAPGQQTLADISGDWVVYADGAGRHGSAIKAYNILTKQTHTVCDWPGDQYFPKISETGYVVWQSVSDPRHPDETMDLYGRSVYGGAIRKIAGGRGSQHSPSIGGNLIVYSDSAKPGGYGLVGYDLLSGTRFGITKVADASVYYDIAGIKDGTIARLRQDYSTWPYLATVQLVWPTELEVIATESVEAQAIAAGDEGLIEETFASPVSYPHLTLAAVASTTTTVVIAASDDWRNTVLACSLAGRYSPLLLVGRTSVSRDVVAKLAALAPRSVVVVGGSGSVSEAALGQIRAAAGSATVTRVAPGGVTQGSLDVAASIAARADWNGTVLIVASGSSSSGLIAVPASVWKGLPIVMVDSKGLSTSQIRGLVSRGAKSFVVVGGPIEKTTLGRLRSAVGTKAVMTISAVSVASTSAKFASWATASLGMTWNGAGVASASDWRRTPIVALSQGRARSVLLLTDPKSLSAPVKEALVAHHRAITHVSFVGTTGFVSRKVRGQVRLAIK